MNTAARTPRRYELVGALPFVFVHLLALGAFWFGVSWQAVLAAIALFGVRMFAVTAGYHRYFSHRSFKTSRVLQLFLAVLAQTSVQKGVLWWAAHHRRHHKLSDQPGDVHSARIDGFWYAHVGWIFNHTSDTDFARVRDLARYPELRFLNRWYLLPPALLAWLMYLWLGVPGLCVGFAASTVAVWHATFAINSLAHLWGRKRFATSDDSRNSMLLALLTLGEGWHNNHHHYMTSARQGFYWWEIDITYYVLCVMRWLGLIWDLRAPPAEVLAAGRSPAAALGLPPTNPEAQTAG